MSEITKPRLSNRIFFEITNKTNNLEDIAMHTLSEIGHLAALAEIRSASPGPAQTAWTHIVQATTTIHERILAPAWLLELAIGELAAAVEELEALAPIDTHLH